MKNKCPYCKKTYCIIDVAFLNCEMYGNEYFTIKCNHCNKVLDITLERTVNIISVCKSTKKSSQTDW